MRAFVLAVSIVGSPTAVFAQAAITGTVLDSSGAAVAGAIATYALVEPSLGRDLPGNAANVTENPTAPGTMYGDRINELNFRAAKTLTYFFKITAEIDL